MPPLALPPDEQPPDLYVEQSLNIEEEFLPWANGDSPGSTRLRSVVGSPGCGKSTFITRFRLALEVEGIPVLWLDLNSPDVDLATFLNDLPVGRVVLLVDGFEDVSEVLRGTVEAKLLLFLFPSGEPANLRYAVVARRDEDGLQEAQLRWEDEIYSLEGLDATREDGPTELIRRRLAAVAADRAGARVILAWEDEDEALPHAAVDFVCTLDDEGRQAFCEDLNSPNPYLNLALLRRKLQHAPTALEDADFYAALASYVRRAGLPKDFCHKLIALGSRIDAHGEMSLTDYTSDGGQAAELEALIAAGIIARPTPALYRVEPAVYRFISRLSPAPATP